MICKYGESDDDNDSIIIANQCNKPRSYSNPKNNRKANQITKDSNTNDDSSQGKGESYLNQELMQLINSDSFCEEPIKKLSNCPSPKERYSKKRIMTRLKTVTLPSSNKNLDLLIEPTKSPKMGRKNYILKIDIQTSKFHTPSINPNQNPLLNYYNQQSCSPSENEDPMLSLDGRNSQHSEISHSLQQMYNFDDIQFPLYDDNTFNNIGFGMNNIQEGNVSPGTKKNRNVKQDYILNKNSNDNIDIPKISGNNKFSNLQEQQHKNIPLNYFDSLNNIKQNYKPSEINTNKLSSEQNFIPSSFYRNNQMDVNKTLDKQDWSYNNTQQPNNQFINQYSNNLQDTNNTFNLNNDYYESKNNLINYQQNYVNQFDMINKNKSLHSNTTADDNCNININFSNQENLQFQNNIFLNSNQIPNNSQKNFGNNNSYQLPLYSNSMETLNQNQIIMSAKELIREQQGCRYLQKYLEGTPIIANQLFDVLENDFFTLSCSSFGNYLIQKLFPLIDFQRMNRYLDIISPFFAQIAISSHGTRVIQKLLEIIKRNSELVMKISNIIKNNFMAITTDINSNHIIQKYVTIVKHPLNNLIYEILYENFLIVSKDKYGCCMMQKCIECGSPEQQQKLIALSLRFSPILIIDQYGNYVLQYIIKTRNQEFISAIVNLLLSNIQQFCRQKFSSNIIEKCLENGYAELQTILINAITQNENLISELLVDLYGNYIIQKLLLMTNGQIYYKILNIIAKNVDQLKGVSFGNRLLTKLMNSHKDLNFLINKNDMLSYQHVNNTQANNRTIMH